MKYLFLLTALFIIAAFIVFAGFTPIVQQDSFKPLHQLTGGTWRMKTAKGYICEQWKKTTDTELSGRGFRVAGADTTVEEQVQLTVKDGYIFYIPTVTGQNDGKPVLFKLISSYKGIYTFSNPEHDYPQVVAYQFVSKDSLNAWIDGNMQGNRKRIDFHYKRIN